MEDTVINTTRKRAFSGLALLGASALVLAGCAAAPEEEAPELEADDEEWFCVWGRESADSERLFSLQREDGSLPDSSASARRGNLIPHCEIDSGVMPTAAAAVESA